MWNVLIQFILVFIPRKLIRPFWGFLKVFLWIIGAFYSILEILTLFEEAHQEWGGYATFVGNVKGPWLLYIIIGIAVASIATAYIRRNRTIYPIKNKNVEISFDFCKVLSGNGHRVIEISNDLCLDDNKIGKTNDLTAFKQKFKKINGSLNLKEILQKSIKELGFKMESNGTGKKSHIYPMGSFAVNDFCGKKHVFVTSIKRDANGRNMTTDNDFTVFLSELWKNMSGQEWKEETIRIPVFSGAGGYTQKTQMRLYLILMTFIRNVKDGNIPCKRLHVCISNDGEDSLDLNSFVSLCRYIDEFETASRPGGKRVGSPLDVASEIVPASVELTQKN